MGVSSLSFVPPQLLSPEFYSLFSMLAGMILCWWVNGVGEDGPAEAEKGRRTHTPPSLPSGVLLLPPLRSPSGCRRLVPISSSFSPIIRCRARVLFSSFVRLLAVWCGLSVGVGRKKGEISKQIE
jgi:hypothetical protein